MAILPRLQQSQGQETGVIGIIRQGLWCAQPTEPTLVDTTVGRAKNGDLLMTCYGMRWLCPSIWIYYGHNTLPRRLGMREH